MIVYFDTSSLVKLYVDETDSDKIKDIAYKATVISTSKIAYVEARAAFARKQKEGGFPLTILRRITEDLNKDWESYFVIEITNALIRSAADIAEKYLLRGFDSIHLASVIALKNKIESDVFFSCSDSKLNRAARKEGIKIL